MRNAKTLIKKTTTTTTMSIFNLLMVLVIMRRRYDNMVVQGYYISYTTFIATTNSCSTGTLLLPLNLKPSNTRFGCKVTTRRTSSLLFSSNRDDEINKLEGQLRQLKLDQEIQDDLEYQRQQQTQRIKDQRFNEVLKGKGMILSEQELIDGGIVETTEAGSNNNDIIVTGVLFIALIAGLISFAQIPVGQESLTQYSATGSRASSFKQIDLGNLNPDNPNTIK